MTISDYIQQRFQTFGSRLSEADIYDICAGMGCTGLEELGLDMMPQVKVAIAKFIPSLLLRATSINESGFSMSWNMEGIKEYYSFLCKEYGLEDKLSQKPKVTFL